METLGYGNPGLWKPGAMDKYNAFSIAQGFSPGTRETKKPKKGPHP